MLDPTSMSPGSLMPSYPWLFDQVVDSEGVSAKINAMRSIGVPYEPGYESIASQDLTAQAGQIAKRLKEELDVDVVPELEIVALIAYLQRLGVDIKGNPTASVNVSSQKGQ